MATYLFRLGFFGNFQLPTTWTNVTAGTIATLAPGLGDTILLNTPNATLQGDGNVDQITVGAAAGAAPFTLSGAVTARQITSTAALTLAAGTTLSLLGRPGSLSPNVTLGAVTLLTNATLTAGGAIALNSTLSATQSSTVTATTLTLRTPTAALLLDNSTLTLANSTANSPSITAGAQSTTTATSRIALTNAANLITDGAIILGLTGTADLTATAKATITAPRITVGAGGTGTLTLNNSSAVIQDLIIAAAAASRGTATLAAGARMQLTGGLQLGTAGAGT